MRTRDVEFRGLSPTERTALIRSERIRAQYRNMPSAFIGSALIASIVAAMLYEKLRADVLIAWLATVYVLSVARFLIWQAFKHVSPYDSDIARWGQLAVLMAGLSGLVWGIGGMVLHVPGSLSHQLFVLLATTGLGFTSSYLAAPMMAAFLAYAVPSFLLSAFPFLLDADRLHVAVGICTLLLLPLAAHFASRVCRGFLDSLNVRLQNLDLVVELRDEKEAAERANAAKSRFLAVASHDLRQPLHALGLFVQALQESAIATHERQLVSNIRRSLDAMEELFDALLDISRLDSGAVRPRIETFRLASMFDRLRIEFGPVAAQRELTLSVMKTSICVRSDPSLLERIVRNLVSNAVRYTDHGGLLLGCRRVGEQVRIEVWDTGRGIAPADQTEVFREFVQLQAGVGAEHKGLGLGLAIVDRLAMLLGHTLQLRSTPGKGSVFGVSVPRGRAVDCSANTAVEFTSAFDLTGMLILVIDAQPAVCQAMEALLGKWNCEVISARSGAEMQGRLAAVRRVPDLIISDYRSPESCTDVEMLRTEFNTQIPALLLTGDTAGGEPQIEGFPILRKPLNPARLRTLIANLLRLEETQERPRRAS